MGRSPCGSVSLARSILEHTFDKGRVMARQEQLQLLALCALEGVTGAQWQAIARQARQPGGLDALLAGRVTERGVTASKLQSALDEQMDSLPASLEWVEQATASALESGARLVTVLDEAYPVNLRRVSNLPPFLFVEGTLTESDAVALAVVGTRGASERGLQQARKMSQLLAERGVTVVSGLAAGIDTAAHEAALESGGRTIAVMGTGILRTYPRENLTLRQRIREHGAVISQFWPDQPPGRHSFPIRNVVTSGISQGTVVIEASHTSGARNQARRAWEHGKEVFLLQSLVTDEKWAQTFIEQGRAIEVASSDDVAAIIDRLQTPRDVYEGTELREQLALELT